MTVTEAIGTVNRLYPNDYQDEEKIIWLQKMDEKIQKELFSRYQDGKISPLPDYAQAEEDVTLLIESPYDLLYLYELQARLAYWQRDMDVYNRANVLYQNIYQTYEREYHRTHKPIPTHGFLF